jgi:hypothetical protein
MRNLITPDYVVRVPFGGGVGVLVGDVILTAAHCMNYAAVPATTARSASLGM